MPSTTTPPLRWGVLGTGKIAGIFCESLRAAAMSTRLVAVGSRDPEVARRFAGEHDLNGTLAATYEEVLAAPDVDVVYIATPHTTHADLIGSAARHGKHVLCEKPLTVNLGEAMSAVTVARDHGVLLVEGFAYRFHPQTSALLTLVESEELGELRLIESVFGYDAGPAPGNYLLEPGLAGGAILDVGCYTMSMTRLLAHVVEGPQEPAVVTGTAHLHSDHSVDTRAVCSLRFPSGLVAQLACAIDVNLGGALRLLGSRGTAVLHDPWLPGRMGDPVITVELNDGTTRILDCHDEQDLYVLELLEVERHVGFGESPRMTISDTLANMAALDSWRRSVGVRYAADTPPSHLVEDDPTG